MLVTLAWLALVLVHAPPALATFSPQMRKRMYGVDDAHLLIVTSDRLSAFDVILSDPIPHKGAVLNAMSNFWFDRLGHVVPNHLTTVAPE